MAALYDNDDDDMIELMKRAISIDDHLLNNGIDSNLIINDNKQYTIKCIKSPSLTPQQKIDVFALFEANMKEMYDKTWGWNKDDKIKELFAPTSTFLIIQDDVNNNKVVAFTMFRFEWDDEEEPEYPVLYCYELQISDECQGKGIGKRLMELLVQFQKACLMRKVMLTCFKINTLAMNFYLKNGFYIDEYSPSKFGDIDCHYEILSNEKPKKSKGR
jgi:ribosomal protein S18 acetylase RimI-like enzyme